MNIQTSKDIAIMKEGGGRLGNILLQLLDAAGPGVSLELIEKMADDLIVKAGGAASFKSVAGYRWATCLCVNEVVVHGIPTPYVLKKGDVLTIDVGLIYQGFHTDTAWTKIIGNQKDGTSNTEEKKRFLKIGEEAMWQAIEQARIGNRIGHISQTIQRIIEGAGYNIVKTLVGHGVGRELHEAPQIPGYLKGSIEGTPELQNGMTIAVEVIYAAGSGAIVYDNADGWTLATQDRSLSAVFEHSIAIRPEGPLILTKAQM
ncbi:type I methionyl aminopeptidase [Candidatus Gottesmanbacteria bacterium]|nr:type I methionyl aminopeptidase [Candidatus Gottesmanbacteria bacterium]